MSESEIQRSILDYLEAIPTIWVARQNTGVARSGGRYIKYGVVGAGDITGVLPGGRRLEIEVKTKEGSLSREQREFGARMRQLGAVYIVARSLEDVVYQLRTLGVVP